MQKLKRLKKVLDILSQISHQAILQHQINLLKMEDGNQFNKVVRVRAQDQQPKQPKQHNDQLFLINSRFLTVFQLLLLKNKQIIQYNNQIHKQRNNSQLHHNSNKGKHKINKLSNHSKQINLPLHNQQTKVGNHNKLSNNQQHSKHNKLNQHNKLILHPNKHNKHNNHNKHNKHNRHNRLNRLNNQYRVQTMNKLNNRLHNKTKDNRIKLHKIQRQINSLVIRSNKIQMNKIRIMDQIKPNNHKHTTLHNKLKHSNRPNKLNNNPHKVKIVCNNQVILNNQIQFSKTNKLKLNKIVLNRIRIQISNPLTNKPPINRLITNKPLINKPLINKQLVNKQLVNKQLISKLLINNQLINRLVNLQIKYNNQPNQRLHKAHSHQLLILSRLHNLSKTLKIPNKLHSKLIQMFKSRILKVKLIQISNHNNLHKMIRVLVSQHKLSRILLIMQMILYLSSSLNK